jgi:phage terminase large subunit
MPSKHSRKTKASSKLKSKAAIGRPRKYKDLIQTKSREVKRDEILVTSVFRRTKECEAGIIVERGGARSSKSYSIAQLLVERLFAYPQFGRKICVLRKTFPALRISIKPMIYSIIDKYGLWDRIREDKMENNLVYGRSFMHFGSLDKPEKIRSSEWNDILLEEANEFTYEDYMNVTLRTSANDFGIKNQLFMNLNPIDAYHWIKEKVIGPDASKPLTKDCVEIHSTYRDNPFLGSAYVEKLEAVKDQDPNYWRIFGEGEWGRLDSLIYTWWTIVEEPKEGEIYYGLDFGFTNPSCLIEVHQDGKECYLIERLYESSLTNSDLIQRLKRIIPENERKNRPIYPDVAEPDRIQEIIDAGFWVIPSEKDVLDGIDSVKRHHLNIVHGVGDSQYCSDNLLKEIRGYSHRKDREGRVLEEPIKFNDHAMSAIRYAIHTHNKNRGEVRIRELSLFDGPVQRTRGNMDPWSFADEEEDRFGRLIR